MAHEEDVVIAEPGTLVLASAQVSLIMAEKATIEGVGVFADAWTVSAAEKRLKNYLEEQLLRDGILAEVAVEFDGVSTEASDFDTSEDAVDEDDTFDTDADPGDEDEVVAECCGINVNDPCDDCPEAIDAPGYITLQLTPAEAAAVRIVTGNVVGDGPLREGASAVNKVLRTFLGYTDAIFYVLDAQGEGQIETGDAAAFNRVVTAYEQALRKDQEPEEQQVKYYSYPPVIDSAQRRVF